jgi:putative metallohydrolase (TIGR04338 family)
VTYRPRDSQRSKLYRAGSVLHPAGLYGWKQQQRFLSVDEMQEYVHDLQADTQIQRHWRTWCLASTPQVTGGRDGQMRALGSSKRLSMPEHYRYEAALLHEVSHSICWRELGRNNHAAHGWEFCAVYLWLVKHKMGNKAHSALLTSMEEYRVQYRQPRSTAKLYLHAWDVSLNGISA